MFAVRDSKTEFFTIPMSSKCERDAVRTFEMACNDSKAMMWQYPEDYDLYEIGDYDDNTGKFHCLDTPRHVIKAVQLRKEEKTNAPSYEDAIKR